MSIILATKSLLLLSREKSLTTKYLRMNSKKNKFAEDSINFQHFDRINIDLEERDDHVFFEVILKFFLLTTEI